MTSPPACEIALDLLHEVGIERGLLGEQDDGRALGEMRRQVDRKADVAEIVLQEVLIRGGLVGLVALDADRIAELADDADRPAASE